MNEALLRKAFKARGDDFDEWYIKNVVEFTCMDCDKEVVRPRHDWLDADGLTPKRCASCTLDAMARA